MAFAGCSKSFGGSLNGAGFEEIDNACTCFNIFSHAGCVHHRSMVVSPGVRLAWLYPYPGWTACFFCQDENRITARFHIIAFKFNQASEVCKASWSKGYYQNSMGMVGAQDQIYAVFSSSTKCVVPPGLSVLTGMAFFLCLLFSQVTFKTC